MCSDRFGFKNRGVKHFVYIHSKDTCHQECQTFFFFLSILKAMYHQSFSIEDDGSLA